MLDTTKVCESCNGTGYDSNTSDDFIEEFGYSWDCQECSGAGYIWVKVEYDNLPEA